MSLTRQLIAELRRRRGEDAPLTKAPPVQSIPAPPRRVFPTAAVVDPTQAAQAAKHTTALVGIGHVGTRYATDVVLQFQAEMAVAKAAVAAELPEDWAHGFIPLQSRVEHHREFLLRPDLGRRLNEESLQRLQREAKRDVDVQVILADGLSAQACADTGPEIESMLRKRCEAHGLRVGSPMYAKFARVWLQDEIGQEVGAKVAIIILGERPGLGTGDGLSAYAVYDPKLGNTDGDRNMISNIHSRGMLPADASERLAMLASAMLEQERSGVELDLGKLEDLIPTGQQAAQQRQALVEKA